MTDKAHKDALVRLFRLSALIQRDEGLKLDGLDPEWRKLCDSPELAEMSDDEMRDRLRALAVVESDDDPASRAEAAERKARFEARMTRARDELIEQVEWGELNEMFEPVAREGHGDEVVDETDSPAA